MKFYWVALYLIVTVIVYVHTTVEVSLWEVAFALLSAYYLIFVSIQLYLPESKAIHRSHYKAKGPSGVRFKSTSSKYRGSHKIKSDDDTLSPLQQWFNQASAKLTNGPTTNPHIIAKRILRDKTPITREVLNSITSLAHKIEVTQAEFNAIANMEFHDFEFPLVSSARSAMNSLIGGRKATLNNRMSAVYIWSNRTEETQYVGGTPNVGRRVRKYIETTKFTHRSNIWSAIKKYGIKDFNLSVALLPAELAHNPDMCWVAEQYWLLKLDPQYNTHKVTGGGGNTITSLQDLEEAIQVQGKPVHFYTADGLTLVHSFSSIYRVLASMPLSRDTVLEHLNIFNMDSECPNPKLLYGQWLISLQELEDVDKKLIETKELTVMMMTSRLKLDNVFDSDLLEQVMVAPHAYPRLIISKPLLATSPLTGETWYFRSYVSFNDFFKELYGFKLSLTILYAVLDKSDKEGLFFGLRLEAPINLDTAKLTYPDLITYHNTPYNTSQLSKVALPKYKNYRDWAKRN